MRLVFALAAAAALRCGPAFAQMPPVFDMVGWCKDDVAAGAYVDVGVLGCVDVEQQKVRALRRIYRTVPADVRAECETFAQDSTNGRGSYAVLDFCVDMQRKR